MRAQGLLLRVLCPSLVALLSVGCCTGSAAETDTDRPVVVVTTTIVGDLATRVVGDDAVVEALIPAGADPCLYEPTSEQTERLLEADLIVSSGLGLETGLADALGEAERRGVRILQLGDELYPLDSADDTDETLDPYWWMDPLRAAGAVTLIADRMLGIRDGDWVMRALEIDREHSARSTTSFATCCGDASPSHVTSSRMGPGSGTSPNDTTASSRGLICRQSSHWVHRRSRRFHHGGRVARSEAISRVPAERADPTRRQPGGPPRPAA